MCLPWRTPNIAPAPTLLALLAEDLAVREGMVTMDESEDRALVRNYTACYLENSRSARRSSAAFRTITTGEIGPADSAGSLMIPAIPGGLLPTLRLGRNQRTYKYSCPVGLQIPFFILSKDVP